MSGSGDPPFVAGRPLTRAVVAWARELHGGQVRAVDHAPFILHPLEVAAVLSGRGFDNEVVAAGLLHDAVEDTGASVEDCGGGSAIGSRGSSPS
jgi:(p)ppGpp synthase/HD superfamily hydrolase